MRLRFSIFIAVLVIASSVFAVEVPDSPSEYVVDLAGVLGGDAKLRLNGYLKELEEKTTAQMVVLTIDSLEGESLDAFSLGVAEKWKLGQKGKDNGVLFLIAMKDRKFRIEVGYGLEGVLPDSLVGSIGRGYLAPNFRKGDYSGGIEQSVLAMAGEIARSSGVEITGMPVVRINKRSLSDKKPSAASAVLAVLFFILVAYLFVKHPRLLLLLLFSGMGRRSGYWGGGYGGGGFGGGGFGGFGGGGGGGFGGGGASGSW